MIGWTPPRCLKLAYTSSPCIQPRPYERFTRRSPLAPDGAPILIFPPIVVPAIFE